MTRRARKLRSKRLISAAELSAFAELRAARLCIDHDRNLDCLDYCPAGTVLEDAVRISAECTDLPPSIAFFSTLALLGASMSQAGFGCKFPDGKFVQPNLWIIALAPSGSGKTLLLEDVSRFLLESALPRQLPDTITAAAFHQYFCADTEDEGLSYRRCRSAFIRDEVNELFKTLRKESGEELRDLILRTYSGSSLVRATKKDGEQSSPPVLLSFYGSAVDTSFFKAIDSDDYDNGLMQRFQFALCHDRPTTRRSWYVFENDVRERARARFDDEWAQILSRERVLQVTPAAMRAFDAWFHSRFNRVGAKRESYFRRAAFAAYKYGTVFAVLGGSESLDAVNLSLALRVIDRHLCDLERCMSEFTAVNDWHAVLLKIRAQIVESDAVTRADVLRGSARGVSSAELNVLLQTLAEEDGKAGDIAARLLGQGRRTVHPCSPRYSPPKNTHQSLAA